MVRIALLVAVLIGCKAKREEQASKPLEVHQNVAAEPDATPAIATDTSAAPTTTCAAYLSVLDQLVGCDKLPQTARDTLKQAREQFVDAWKSPSEVTTAMIDSSCKAGLDAVEQSAQALGCAVARPTIPPRGTRDVPGEAGVPLDRAVLGSLPRPFGALSAIKRDMTREQILAAIPEARRDGDDISVPLGVDEYIAKIDIDHAGHVDDIVVEMATDTGELFEQAWGKPEGTSEARTWISPQTGWRADLDDTGLHLFPYSPIADVVGTGPDGLPEKQALVGAKLADLKARYGDRIEEWTDTDEEGTETTKWRFILAPTEVCFVDTNFLMDVNERDVVTRATLTQCFDEGKRAAALAGLEKRWGRATATRTKDDRLAFRFARPGRTFEMTEVSELAWADNRGAWVVTISR